MLIGGEDGSGVGADGGIGGIPEGTSLGEAGSTFFISSSIGYFDYTPKKFWVWIT